MPLTAACVACGKPVTLTDEMVQDALNTGAPLIIKHDVCPEELSVALRKFKMRIQVFEIHEPEEEGQEPGEELMASFGGDAEAPNFPEALGPLLKELNKGWEQVQNMAGVIDLSG